MPTFSLTGGVIGRDYDKQRGGPGAHVHRQTTMWRGSERLTIFKPRRKASEETSSVCTSDFSASRAVRKSVSVVEATQSVAYLVTTAPVN